MSIFFSTILILLYVVDQEIEVDATYHRFILLSIVFAFTTIHWILGSLFAIYILLFHGSLFDCSSSPSSLSSSPSSLSSSPSSLSSSLIEGMQSYYPRKSQREKRLRMYQENRLSQHKWSKQSNTLFVNHYCPKQGEITIPTTDKSLINSGYFTSV